MACYRDSFTFLPFTDLSIYRSLEENTWKTKISDDVDLFNKIVIMLEILKYMDL
jgi:hypothetical protein